MPRLRMTEIDEIATEATTMLDTHGPLLEPELRTMLIDRSHSVDRAEKWTDLERARLILVQDVATCALELREWLVQHAQRL